MLGYVKNIYVVGFMGWQTGVGLWFSTEWIDGDMFGFRQFDWSCNWCDITLVLVYHWVLAFLTFKKFCIEYVFLFTYIFWSTTKEVYDFHKTIQLISTRRLLLTDQMNDSVIFISNHECVSFMENINLNIFVHTSFEEKILCILFWLTKHFK